MLQECLLALDVALRDLPNTSLPIEVGEAIDLMYTPDLLRIVPSHHNRSGTVPVMHTELFDDSCDQAGGDLSRFRSQRCLSMSIFESNKKPQEYGTPGSYLAISNAPYRGIIGRVAYRTSTLPDVESLPILEGDRIVDIAHHLDVVSWHNHLGAIFDILWPV